MFISFAISIVMLLPMFAIGATLILWKRLDRRRKRRSPLTSELLRPPGFGLSEKLDELRWDVGSYLFAAALFPAMLLASFFARTNQAEVGQLQTTGTIYAVGGMLMLAFLAVRSIGKVKMIQSCRDGRNGELATAQLLEPIIAGGGRVLHDIQANGFNIDHVVVAPGGVFAVETKHRLKPITGKGKDDAKVSFDGKALRFPDWTDTRTAEQAAAQARWLSDRLSRSTGLAVKARPVIALPGWYVSVTERRADVWAMNPKNCAYMLKPAGHQEGLSAATIRQVAFQVEQLCRLPDPSKAARKD